VGGDLKSGRLIPGLSNNRGNKESLYKQRRNDDEGGLTSLNIPIYVHEKDETIRNRRVEGLRDKVG